MQCALLHEETHVKDPNTFCPSECGFSLLKTNTPENSECQALSNEVQCLKNGKKQCTTDICRRLIDITIESRFGYWNDVCKRR